MCRYLFEVLSISLLLNPCVVFLKISEKKQRFRLVVFRSTIFIQRSRGKGPAIKEKRTFFGTFKFFCCHSKIILLLDNLSKYGHITFKFVGRYFIWVVSFIFSKNRAILVQKYGKNPFRVQGGLNFTLPTLLVVRPLRVQGVFQGWGAGNFFCGSGLGS